MTRLRRIRFMLRHPKYLWWATQNRIRGYRFGYVRRHRCCDHTTPSHYRICPQAVAALREDGR
jgi:hypothetical protein